MSTHIKDSQPVTGTYGDQDSLAFHDAVDTITTEQPNGAADPTIQGLQNPRFQLGQGVRHLPQIATGVGRLGPPAWTHSAGLLRQGDYDLFEKLLVAQRRVIDELIAAQRHFAQECLATTPTVGDALASR
jgi:hypothetical protein